MVSFCSSAGSDSPAAGKGTQFDPNVVDCFVRIAYEEHAGVFAATGTGTAVSF